MEQRCLLPMIWLTWLGLPLLGVVVALRLGVAAGLGVLLVGIGAQVLAVRQFPRISRWMGYGSVEDTPAPAGALPSAIPTVTLYAASACPFCPIVQQRLHELRRRQPFELIEVDVTFRPGLIREKGLRSVPVVEVNGRTLVGNATTAQLAELLADASAAPAMPPVHQA
jgi:glutaredoxin